nr:ATPase subunit 4, mitochondrial [Tanacetum cinerariifolium]
MLSSVNSNFLAFSVSSNDMMGQSFASLVPTMAAAESAIGLAIFVITFRVRGTIAVESTNQGFIIFSRKSLGKTFKETLDGRIQAIQEESQQFLNPNEVVPSESNEQQRLLRISLRICGTVVESLPMARTMAIYLSLRVAPLDLQQGGNSRIPYPRSEHCHTSLIGFLSVHYGVVGIKASKVARGSIIKNGLRWSEAFQTMLAIEEYSGKAGLHFAESNALRGRFHLLSIASENEVNNSGGQKTNHSADESAILLKNSLMRRRSISHFTSSTIERGTNGRLPFFPCLAGYLKLAFEPTKPSRTAIVLLAIRLESLSYRLNIPIGRGLIPFPFTVPYDLYIDTPIYASLVKGESAERRESPIPVVVSK